jgi:RPA family protein
MEENPRPVMQRQTAYKIWINELHNTAKETDSDTGMSYLPVKGKNVVRVNLFGVVADKAGYEGYATIVLDDSSGSIRARVWGDDLYLLEKINIGDPVFVIARWAEFNDERYLRPEIVRKVSMDWALYRRLELTKMFGLPSKENKVAVQLESSKVPEVEPTLADRESIISIIDKNEEASEQLLVQESGKSIEQLKPAINDLLKEGEIFAAQPGVYRLV